MAALRNVWENFKNHLSPYMFAMYALALTLISFIIELSPSFQSNEFWLPYSVFGVCMLSVSIAFYIFVGLTNKYQVFGDASNVVGVGAETFFLRLGATVFASFAIVLWTVELFLAFADSVRPPICVVRTFLYICFNVTQLLFVLRSSHIVFHFPRLLVYFGLAHCLVVNLWTWVSLCVAKSGLGIDDHETHIIHFATDSWVLHPTESPRIVNTTFDRLEKRMRTVRYFGTTAISLLTGNVEFCLLSAGVCLSLFITSAKNRRREPEQSVRYVGFDGRNTEVGVGLGVVMLVLTCFAFLVSSILKNSNYPQTSDVVIGSSQIVLYVISIATCCTTYYCLLRNVIRQPNVNGVIRNENSMSHQKTIDVIFLLIGAGGEVLFCTVGLLGVLNCPDGLSSTVFPIRLLEVVIQAILLFYLLQKGNQVPACNSTGKQSITFLIAINIILFGFHTLETTVKSFGFTSDIDTTNLIFLKIAIPLVVFYRFQSAVCFAEIWKAFYHNEVIAISIPTSPRLSIVSAESYEEVLQQQAPVSLSHLITPDPRETPIVSSIRI